MKRKVTLSTTEIKIIVRVLGEAWEESGPGMKADLERILVSYFGVKGGGAEAFKLAEKRYNAMLDVESRRWRKQYGAS